MEIKALCTHEMEAWCTHEKEAWSTHDPEHTRTAQERTRDGGMVC